MISNFSQHGLGTTSAAPLRNSRLQRAATHTSRHLATALRIAHRRPSALALILATAAVLTTAATVGTALVAHSNLLYSTIEPLASTPAPPAPPAAALARPHRLVADLNKINPLRGLASWYGEVWNGRTTASGETFDETKLTAAHKTLPLGTIVRVTNLDSMRSVIVKINDRGTLAPHRIIDLSGAAARELGMIDNGLARVKLEILGKI